MGEQKIPQIIVYTDGAARGNPGPGGYGVVLISGSHRKELSQGFQLTTNNRMELMAAIVGLEALKTAPCNVTIYTDSKYVADSVEKKWVFNWVKIAFKGKKKNSDLWKTISKDFTRSHRVEVHLGERPCKYSPKMSDAIIWPLKASFQSNLPDDIGYQPDK